MNKNYQGKNRYINPLEQKKHKGQNWKWLEKFTKGRLPMTAFLLVTIWAFCSFVYDDVFYMTQQFSYFSFDPVILKEVFYLPEAPIVWIGRLGLVLFKYPILGGFVYALILTTISVLIGYIFRLKNWFKLIMLLPFVWLGVLVYFGLDIFFQYEPSFVWSFPLIALLVLAIAAGVMRFIKKYSFVTYLKSYKEDKWYCNYAAILAVMLCFAGFCNYVYTKGENTVYTCRMQRYLEDEKWQEMIDLAQSAKNVSRPVAAYYAIALEMTDQLNDKLFDIYYQYPELHLTNRTGNPDIGFFLFEPDLDLYSGLLNASYHNNMEHLVSSGLQVYRLRQMFFAALLNGENMLAWKYLNALDKAPFEQAFVKKYKPMLFDKTKILSDPTLARIADMYPRVDAVEEMFEQPLFIGYHKRIPRGSKRTLMNSMAVSLYTKDIKDFVGILPALANEEYVPRSFEEALIVNALNSKDKEFMDRLPDQITSPLREMLTEGNELEAEGYSPQHRGLAMKDKYLGRYSFYYYYENVNDHNNMNGYVSGTGKSDPNISKVN